MMNYRFCTLFDSYYLDKGLALYGSLERHSSESVLYVLCMDDASYEILTDMDLKNLVPISHRDFETDELIVLKDKRTRAEYNWTCTAASIRYIMDRFKLEDLTYIDADMYFFGDPAELMEEIYSSGSDIAIMEHRFNPHHRRKRGEKIAGQYCVEWNYFNNSDNARKALDWWISECMNWCSFTFDPGSDEYPYPRFGDQRYLEQFPERFENVHVMEHLGGGVAPWNMDQYRLADDQDIGQNDNIRIYHWPTKASVNLILVHFQNIKYIRADLVNVYALCRDKKLKYRMYSKYLTILAHNRREINERYGIEFQIKRSSSGNGLVAWIQRNIMPYRVTQLSDLMRIPVIREIRR